MICCKRVYEAPATDDGYRVLVDRLWPRGVKKTDLHYDEWAKSLTPSAELRKAFHGETIDFNEFSKCYQEELKAMRGEARALIKRADNQTITLLYGAKNTGQNHARVLADFLRHLED